MSLDLNLLVWSVALAFGQMLIAVLGACEQVGCRSWPVTARSTPRRGLGRTAQRAHMNMLQNLVLFAALVLTAHVAAGRTP